MNEKSGKIQTKKDKLASGANQEEQKRMAAERAVREAKAQAILAKQTVAETPAAETASESSEENA